MEINEFFFCNIIFYMHLVRNTIFSFYINYRENANFYFVGKFYMYL